MKPILPGAAATAATLALSGWFLISCLQPADEIMDKSGTAGKIVFVKERSVTGNRSIAMASNMDEFYPGTDLCLLSPIGPGGNLTNLTAQWTRTAANENDWGAAQDPEVSFDGAKILFSMKKSRSAPWHIYEMDADGNNLVQLTNQTVGADVDPAYLDENHIVFASSRNQILDEYERRSVPQLFVGEKGGSEGLLRNIRQITFNQSHDQNPFVHSGGKIYFSRWDHLGDPNKIPLFTVNADGTGQFVLFGADETFGSGMGSGSRTFLEARELGDHGIVTSLMERASDFEGGAICIIDLSKSITAPPQIITPSTSPYNTTQKASDALFKTPYPIMDNGKERILMAQSPREAGRDIDGSVNYDLFVMDKDGKNLKLIHADASTNDYDPVVIAPRTLAYKPYKVDSSVAAALEQGGKTGMFFDANVYSRMGNDPNRSSDGQIKPKPGQARFLRVLQAVSMPSANGMRGGNVGRTEFEKQRVMGYADIRSDGSFSIEVPANTPLHVQTLDSNAMMLVNQLQWINVMPGERRVCTGCHGARERDADIRHFTINSDNTVAFNMGDVKTFLSGFNNAQKVTEHPSARADTVDFHVLKGTARTNTVQAVLDRNCISCHGVSTAAGSGGNLVLEDRLDTAANNDGLSSVYETLTREDGYAADLSYVNSNGARHSPLAWVMYHKQLNDGARKFRNSSYDHSQIWAKDGAGRPDPFDAKNADLLTLIEWMDMGIQFSNTVGKGN